MKDKRHIKSFNEATENLNISDVRSSKLSESLSIRKLRKKLNEERVKLAYSGEDKVRNVNTDFL